MAEVKFDNLSKTFPGPVHAVRELSRRVVIELRSNGGAPQNVRELREVCLSHHGGCPLYLRITSDKGWITTVEAGAVARVDPTSEFLSQVQAMVGQDNVECLGADSGSRGR